jgi:hypothetical protein
VARARAPRTERTSGIKAPEAKVLTKFVSLVSRLPFVEQVLAVPGCEGVEIRTIIDAEPFADEPRDQVYEAELAASVAEPDAMILLRLINRRECGDEAMEWLVPTNAHVAWRRPAQP